MRRAQRTIAHMGLLVFTLRLLRIAEQNMLRIAEHVLPVSSIENAVRHHELSKLKVHPAIRQQLQRHALKADRHLSPCAS